LGLPEVADCAFNIKTARLEVFCLLSFHHCPDSDCEYEYFPVAYHVVGWGARWHREAASQYGDSCRAAVHKNGDLPLGVPESNIR
jgi:hypothetical protein